MITWGLLSAAMMLVTSVGQFYVLRFLLGVAEAGFFPGIVYYLTHWFPESRRARVISMFLTGVAISGVIGGPLSGWILGSMSGVRGLAGWQWLFLLEGIPSGVAAVAMVLLGYSSDRMRERRWHLVGMAIVGAIGLVIAGRFSTSLPIALTAMSAAMAASLSNIALFWTLPTAALRGASAAAGIAAINSIGNLAGFLSPYLIGVVKDATGAATYGLYVIAVFMLLGAVLVIIATPRTAATT